MSSSGRNLNAAYLARPTPTIGLIGTSIAYNGGYTVADPLVEARSFLGWANVLLGHAFSLGALVDGVPGSAITGTDFPARLTAMLAQPVDIVMIEMLSNDVGGGASLAAIQSACTDAFTRIKAAGKRPVMLTCPPRGGLSVGQRSVWGQINSWLRQQEQSVPGLVIADVAAYLTDPANATPANYVAIYDSGDGIHPNVSGAQQMGRAIAVALAPLSPGSSAVLLSPGDPANLLSQQATSYSGGGGAQPAGWFGGAGTFSQVARTDDIPGVWQQVTLAAGGATTMQSTLGGFAAGDVVRAFLEFQTANQEPLAAHGQRFTLSLQAYLTPAYTVLGYTADVYAYSGTEDHLPMPSGIYLTPPFVVPATTNELDLTVAMSGGGDYLLGRVGVAKVVA